MQSQFLPEELKDYHQPVDDIEPKEKPFDEVRRARVDAIRIINCSMAHIGSAIGRPGATLVDVAVSYWQVAFGMGLNCVDGLSMTQIADNLMVERATISKGAVQFCLANDLEPSLYMKREESRPAYQKARLKSIKCTRKKKSKAA